MCPTRRSIRASRSKQRHQRPNLALCILRIANEIEGFAILVYRPAEEFRLRQQVRRLSDELKTGGWGVLSISLQKLLLDRIRATGEANVTALSARERRLHERDPERALSYLRDRVAPHIEGPNGIAADVIRLIGDFADAYPNQADHTVIFVGRAGALYPF